MSEERSIQDYLDDILNAVYGEEVRDSIVGAITKCYEDGRTGSVDAIARGRLDVIEPVVDSTKQTADTNVLATLQSEKALSQDGIHDLNQCTETGKYYASSATIANGVSNQPSDKQQDLTFAVLVINVSSVSNVVQILIDTHRKMWMRIGSKSSGTWTFYAWYRYLFATDYDTLSSAIDTKANKTNAELTGAPVATTASDNDDTTRIATTAYVMRECRKKANANNAELTGTPKAPTATAGTNTTQIATTAFVASAVSTLNSTITTALAKKANLASPPLTGKPTAPTATAGTNTTQIATTAFVTTAVGNVESGLESRISALEGITQSLDSSKAPKESPTLSGTPKVPTPAASSNDTTIANTQYVTRAISNFKGAFDTAMSSSSVNAVQNKVVNTALAAKAPKASPAFTGTPTAPTVSGSSDSSTKVATTAFVQAVKNAALASRTYANNATLTLKNYASFSGYIGSSKKFVGFLVPVPKSLENVDEIAITSITGAVFGVNGAVSGSTYTTDWRTHKQDDAIIFSGATAEKVANNLIQVSMHFGGALSNSTNLSPITFVATNLAFKFTVN